MARTKYSLGFDEWWKHPDFGDFGIFLEQIPECVLWNMAEIMSSERFWRKIRHNTVQSAYPLNKRLSCQPYTDREIEALAREQAAMLWFGGPYPLDLSVFSPFTALRSLNLDDKRSLIINDVSPLSVLTNLQDLDFGICLAIPNLQTLSVLAALTFVTFRASIAIPDLSPLANLARLKVPLS